jgi:hypothetical protein
MGAMNTRFGIYQGVLNQAEVKQACPADTNIKEYIFSDDVAVGWLDVAPEKQSLDGGEEVGPSIVQWSAVAPSAGATPTVTGYPDAGSGASGEFAGTPYGQTSGSYFEAPPATVGGDPVASQSGRRIITVAIASNCDTEDLNGSNKPVNIVAFGRFVMQRTGVGTGNPEDRGFYAEFLNMVTTPPVVLHEIKLHR